MGLPGPGMGSQDYSDSAGDVKPKVGCYNTLHCIKMGLLRDKCCCVMNNITGQCSNQCISDWIAYPQCY